MRRLIVVLILPLLVVTVPAYAQANERCFPETGFCITGTLRTYWETNGGLAVFGYPISPLRDETVEGWRGPVQWFERDRLEDHGADGVLAGRLGADVLAAQGRPWQSLPQVTSAPAGCRFFPETQHSICSNFLAYWEANGGLTRFGYPISESFEDAINGPGYYPVQYFERRRLELHGTHGHGQTPEVLLGLLGRNVLHFHGCDPADKPLAATAATVYTRIGCPSWVGGNEITQRVGATQPFEHGLMLWVNNPFLNAPEGYGTIYVLVTNAAGAFQSWQVFQESDLPAAPTSSPTPPPGLFAPQRGFGRLWHGKPEIRDALGWATAPESAESATLQHFRSDSLLASWGNPLQVAMLLSGGQAEAVTFVP